jgi:hypothetical protein
MKKYLMLGAALAALISTPVQATGMDSSTECLAKELLVGWRLRRLF